MIGLLASIKAAVTTLTGRLTSTRAGYLDNLDAAVSTRAASATALSSATWTAARAGYLDKIGVKSIQQGTITVTSVGTESAGSNTATISSVDPTKAICVLQGFTVTNNVGTGSARVSLTDATTVTADVRNCTTETLTFVVGYTVIEFNG